MRSIQPCKPESNISVKYEVLNQILALSKVKYEALNQLQNHFIIDLSIFNHFNIQQEAESIVSFNHC